MKKIVCLIILNTLIGNIGYSLEVDSSRYEILSGRKLNNEQKGVWDKKFSSRKYVFGKKPAFFLEENMSYLPKNSKILDMGMGEGRNAVFLASKGHQVVGVDISSVAVKKAKALAKEFGVKIKGVIASLNDYRIAPGEFDAIICFYYVDRKLVEKMVKWLKPGGILFFEAYTTNQIKLKKVKHQNKQFLLEPLELLTLFKGLKVLKFEEPLHKEDYTSSIILQKE